MIDLLNKGQGVFAIALDKVWDDLEGNLATRKAGRDGSRRRVSAEPTSPDELRKSDTVGFAHASERQFAQLLDFYEIEWEYEPTLVRHRVGRRGQRHPAVHARLLPADLRPLHRDHDAEPEARHEEEPQGPPAP